MKLNWILILIFWQFISVKCALREITENSSLIDIANQEDEKINILAIEKQKSIEFKNSETYRNFVKKAKEANGNFYLVFALINKLAQELRETELRLLINAKVDGFGNTLLHQAIEKNNLLEFLVLLQYGADINIKNNRENDVKSLSFNRAAFSNAITFAKSSFDRANYVYIPEVKIIKNVKPNNFLIRTAIGSIVILPTLTYIIYTIFNLTLRH